MGKGLEKLCELANSIGCYIFKPSYIKRLGKAEAFRWDTLAETARRNCDVPIRIEDDKLTIDNTNLEQVADLAQRTGKRLAYQEMSRQQNIESVITKAYEELENDEDEVSDEPVDNDWILRFFRSVEDISNEEMQQLWAKILAGEIKKPKTFSLRTLERMRNLSQQEALLFVNMSNYILYYIDLFVFYEYKLGTRESIINVNDLLILEECGLLNFKELSYTISFSPQGRRNFRNDYYIIEMLNKRAENTNESLRVLYLTNFGRELYNIIKKNDDIDSIKEIALILKKKYYFCDIILKKYDKIKNIYISDNLLEEQ